MPGVGRGRTPGSEGPLGIRDASFVGIVEGVVIEFRRRCRRWRTADHGPVKKTPRTAFISYGIPDPLCPPLPSLLRKLRQE
ncbi:hypothetical protein ALC62_09633 [Cyphomyrmex costatus]|uniref:Uncharacterized protein n=1 Tax=Cyphomyrmex costatus TaxID=456900 RepID=A0A151IFE0_9HYME|nr:hypothetical protein ALC62_09633 [Cyphomyrmex costatus]